jgi:hypothetical protein
VRIAHQNRSAFSLDDGSSDINRSMTRPAANVAGCIHDTYPMIATCTTIHAKNTAAAAMVTPAHGDVACST